MAKTSTPQRTSPFREVESMFEGLEQSVEDIMNKRFSVLVGGSKDERKRVSGCGERDFIEMLEAMCTAEKRRSLLIPPESLAGHGGFSLREIWRAMQDYEMGVATKLKKVRSRLVPVFSGKAAVDWIATNIGIQDRKEAIELAQKLMSERMIYEIHYREHTIRDSKDILYTFQQEDARFVEDENNNMSTDCEEHHKQNATDRRRSRHCSVRLFGVPLGSGITVDDLRREESDFNHTSFNLELVWRTMFCPPRGLEVRTRWRRMAKYKKCFLGREAVDWLVKTLDVPRSVAVKIGQWMLERGLIAHLPFHKHRPFADENFLYTPIMSSNRQAAKKKRLSRWFSSKSDKLKRQASDSTLTGEPACEPQTRSRAATAAASSPIAATPSVAGPNDTPPRSPRAERYRQSRKALSDQCIPSGSPRLLRTLYNA